MGWVYDDTIAHLSLKCSCNSEADALEFEAIFRDNMFDQYTLERWISCFINLLTCMHSFLTLNTCFDVLRFRKRRFRFSTDTCRHAYWFIKTGGVI